MNQKSAIRRPQQRQQSLIQRSLSAFTLVECLLALAVLGVAVAAVAQAVSAGQMQTYESLHHARATALAQAAMEEVLSKPYTDPQETQGLGPDAGETTRSLYDNCDDYNSLTEVAGQLRDGAGVLYSQPYQVFSRSIAAAYETAPGMGGSVSGVTVTVSITDARGMNWTISRFVPAP